MNSEVDLSAKYVYDDRLSGCGMENDVFPIHSELHISR